MIKLIQTKQKPHLLKIQFLIFDGYSFFLHLKNNLIDYLNYQKIVSVDNQKLQ